MVVKDGGDQLKPVGSSNHPCHWFSLYIGGGGGGGGDGTTRHWQPVRSYRVTSDTHQHFRLINECRIVLATTGETCFLHRANDLSFSP